MVTLSKLPRREVDAVKRAKGWVLVHGRRKVGKTFLVRNFIDHDLYVLVKRGGGALFEGGPLRATDDCDQAVELILKFLDDGKTVVVDEFHRLPPEFLESLQMHYPNGRLLLLGSSMHVAREILSKRSPLLGLLSEVRLSLLAPSDIFSALSNVLDAEDALALSPYLRDPWALRYLDPDDPKTTVPAILEYARSAIPSLIGETFLDEDRFLSEVYEGILRSFASGKTTLKEASDMLFSRKVVPVNDPARIRPYVKTMGGMDLVERVPFYKERGGQYALRSKIMELHYYLDEKYGPEGTSPSLVREVVRDRSPLHIQSFVGELMAEILDGTFNYHAASDHDVDFIVTKRNRPILVGEVKWTRHVSRGDAIRFGRNTEHFDCKKVLVSKAHVDGIDSLTPDDLLKRAKAHRSRLT